MPDVPACGNCGATKADDHGPVIPMRPANPWQDRSGTTLGTNSDRAIFLPPAPENTLKARAVGLY